MADQLDVTLWDQVQLIKRSRLRYFSKFYNFFSGGDGVAKIFDVEKKEINLIY